MYIILKTDKPAKTQITQDGQKAHFLYAENISQAKKLLKELEDTENSDYWSTYNASPKLLRCREFNDYLKQIILEPNKLTIAEMRELCLEAQEWYGLLPDNAGRYDICYYSPFQYHYPHFCLFKEIWAELLDIINRYTQTKNNIPYLNNVVDYDFHPVRDFGLKFHFHTSDMENMYNRSLCGALNMRFYKFIYYFDFLGIKIQDERLRKFWDFYKRTLNVYTIEMFKEVGLIHYFSIVPKPDEIFIKEDILHYSYIFGNHTYKYYCDGIEVEKWFYDSNRKDLKLSDFNKIKNADMRSLFIKKAGMAKFIRRGEVIDTWENYPENEWWAKSEYKLIDMKKLLVKKIITTPSGRVLESKNYDYAPFLCMKNQTTGEYHLEGVSPDCKNLYDALKMRYKGLDLPVYEVKNIK